MQKTKRTNKERGQSLTELALSFTVIMFLMAGTVDLGRAFYAFVTLHEAAQEGAIYGSLNPGDATGIIQHVRTNSSDPIDIGDLASVDVFCSIHVPNSVSDPTGVDCASAAANAACTGNEIVVRVTLDLNLIMPLIGVIVPSQRLTLTAREAHTILRPPCP